MSDQTSNLYHDGGIVKKETVPTFTASLVSQREASQKEHHYRQNSKHLGGDFDDKGVLRDGDGYERRLNEADVRAMMKH